MSTRKSNSMIKAITSLKNYRSVRSGSWVRTFSAKVISAALIFSLLTLSTPGAPKWTLVMAQETATDIRFAYLSTSFSTPGWANSVLAFFIGDRKAPKITSIEIQPADATVMQGETINFAAIARSVEGSVPAVQYRWTFSGEGDTERSTRGFHNGVFNATRPGRYVITATGNGAQGQTTLTVYPNEGYGVQKKLQRSESERSERDRQIIQRLTEQGVLTSRTISSRDSYSAESERQRGLADEQRREAIRQKQNEARQRNPDPLRQSVNRTDEPAPEEDNVAQSGKGGPRVDDEAETVVEAPPPVPSAPPAARLMDVIGWDDTNWNTADDPGNQVGSPPGSAPDSGASNGNFRLSAPVLSLGGRGLDVNLALTYNSRLWSKSGTTMTYDADDGFPAPGWSIGFGKMIYTGANGGCMLITPDGTRRSYTGSNTTYGSGTYYTNYFNGYSTDGSLIDYTCYYSNSTYGTTLSGSARLSNGTTITYSSPTGNYKQVYPTRITDSQGNFITITYVSNQGPRINTITDTLGRAVTFNYDSNNRLINVTGPGYNSTTRTFVRITYAQKTLSYAFASGYTTSTQSNTPYLIESIYYPETNTGYWFGDTDSYSSYGMIAKVQSQRGMGWSGSSGTQGTTTEGTVNREEVYNFDMTANSALTDAPGYTLHSETWDRMDGSSAAETAYSVATVSNTEVITVTRPDGSKSKQTSVSNSSSWDDGLYFQNEILSPSDDVLSKTKIYLAQGSYGSSRPTKIETTDELEQMTKVEFTYGTSYNQVTAQKEFDYAGNLYRETRYAYENNAAYTNRHIFSLVKKVEQYDASNNRQSLTEYQYDNNAVVNGTSSHGLVAATGVVQHDFTSDPYTTETNYIEGYCNQWEYEYPECDDWTTYAWVGEWPYLEVYCPDHRTCVDWVEGYYVSAYNESSLFRGNVTKATTYADADSSPSGAISYDFTYDITGNQRTATTNCCEEMSFSYSTTTQFSQPDSVTKGSSDTQSPHRITTSATYDFNTGVMKTSTDANSRTTTVAYDAVARPTLVTAPTGGKSTTDYDDANWRPTKTVQLSDNTVVSKTKAEMNGRGQPRISGYYVDATNLNNTAIEYDVMGRRKKVSMPYASSGSAAYWTEYTYDYLSRVTEVKAPDNSTSKTFYNEPITVARPDSANPASTHKGQTVKSQDAWGRERWARTDAFGRLVEVVEPNPAGNGTVAATGSLMTSYSYNEFDLIALITQGSQTRSFKYDSLGRLTRQKLAEQTATINDAGIYNGTGPLLWSDAFVYDNRSNLTERTDARGVKTNFSYDISSATDPLNRLHGITYNTSSADTTYTINAAPAVSIEYMTSGDKMRVKKVITSGVATEENTYDADGRVTGYSLTFDGRTSYPMVTSYAYDSASRLTAIQYPKQYGMTSEPQKLIEPSYDYASRLGKLEYNGSDQLDDIVYNHLGQVTQMKVGEAMVSGSYYEDFTYDSQTGLLTGQEVSLVNGSTSTPLLELSYGYDRGYSKGTLSGKTGQLTHIIDSLDRNKDRVYEHDALGRLIKAKGGAATGVSGPTANWTQDYSFDRYGNKTGTTAAGITADSNTVPLDGLASVSYTAATNRISNTTGWEYDLSGNLIRGQNESGVWQRFEYDAAGRLVKIKDDSNNVLETYTYGALRNRMKKETATQRTYYAWGGNSPIIEYTEATASSTPAYSKSYIYAGSRLVSSATKASATGETWNYHHPDRLGTRLISNPDTVTSNRQSSLPFGTALDAESTGYSNQIFTTYDRSALTGLDYAVNRTYSKGQGRFTQVDPSGLGASTLGDPQSFNLYSYVQNSPIEYVDPSGLDEIGAAVSAAQELLQFAPCAGLFRGVANPGERLGSIYASGRIRSAESVPRVVGTASGYIESGPPQSFGGDVAVTVSAYYTPPGGRRRRTVVGIYIDSNGQFFNPPGSETSIFAGSRIFIPSGDRNAMTIIHELMHWLMNAPGGAGHSERLNRSIYVRCFLLNPRWRGRNQDPVTTTSTTPSDTITPRPLEPIPPSPGGSGGGPVGGGFNGGYPSWWFEMQRFLDWIDSIEVGEGTVTVDACVGSDCNS